MRRSRSLLDLPLVSTGHSHRKQIHCPLGASQTGHTTENRVLACALFNRVKSEAWWSTHYPRGSHVARKPNDFDRRHKNQHYINYTMSPHILQNTQWRANFRSKIFVFLWISTAIVLRATTVEASAWSTALWERNTYACVFVFYDVYSYVNKIYHVQECGVPPSTIKWEIRQRFMIILAVTLALWLVWSPSASQTHHACDLQRCVPHRLRHATWRECCFPSFDECCTSIKSVGYRNLCMLCALFCGLNICTPNQSMLHDRLTLHQSTIVAAGARS